MNSETMEKNAKEITFVTILTVLKKYLVWILLSTFVLGIVGVLYSAIFQKTKYTATVEFNVVNALSDNEYTSDSMLSAASRIATTCVEIAEKNVLHRAVVESNNIDALLNCQKDEAIKRVADLIKADKGSDDSQIFSVTVTSEDKTLTYVLIKAFLSVLP